MRVEPVAGRADLAAFVDLPFTLYRDDPNWVPPLKAEVRKLLDARRHPFYGGGREAEIELFLARDGRRVVGRVAAILNHAHNRVHDEPIAFFGFFECERRPEVAAALLATVEDWARQRGLEAVRGPMNPSTNYECGLLVEGFDRPPVLMMTYNPPWYAELLEAAGYAKVKDLYAYLSEVHDASLERLRKLGERAVKRNPGLTTRSADLKRFDSEVALIKGLYNAAWEKNWGFVPMSDAEFDALARELKALVHPELVRIAFVDDEPVGFILTVPDWNPVLADLGGSVWRHPFKLLRHLLFTKAESLPGLRLVLLGVRAGFRNRGVESLLFAHGIEVALRAGYEWCEYSWILEDNELTKRAVRLMGGELYKVYRVYEKNV
ncbi:MAG TPA: N-acetyltransferase [Methylomirabilota bacterium]|nr:N-acetyltransferase [Methylomirabilota bacterium]